MTRTKPTGHIGPQTVRKTKTGITYSWDKIEFPKAKEEIEDYFCERFVEHMKAKGASFHKVQKNSENGIDYTLSLPGGEVSLELTEYVRIVGKGSPYLTESNVNLDMYCEAERLLAAVMKKSAHYQPTGKPVHLLVYVTHWAFAVPDPSIALVKHWLLKQPPIFENVFLYMPLDEKEGVIRCLHPSTADYMEVDPESLRGKFAIIADPAGAMFSF